MRDSTQPPMLKQEPTLNFLDLMYWAGPQLMEHLTFDAHHPADDPHRALWFNLFEDGVPNDTGQTYWIESEGEGVHGAFSRLLLATYPELKDDGTVTLWVSW